MDQNLESLRKKGLGVAAISYDSVAVLKHFSDRKGIRVPLLSDPDSKTIREYGLFNEAVPKANLAYGVPHPVTLIAGQDQVVRTKYFEEDYRERQTLAGVLSREYGVAPSAARADTAAKHIKIETSASTASAAGGQRILLALDVEVPQGYHLYAPGTQGYIPLEWMLKESPAWKAHDVSFPKSKIVHLRAIKEKVPTYEGRFRLTRDVTMGADRVITPLLSSSGELTIDGSFRYQACTDRVCYPPETVPVKWTVKRQPHDSQRVPPELRRTP